MVNFDWRNVRMKNRKQFLIAGLFGVAAVGIGVGVSIQMAVGQDPAQEAATPIAFAQNNADVITETTVATTGQEAVLATTAQAPEPASGSTIYSAGPNNQFQFVGPGGQHPAMGGVFQTHNIQGPMHHYTFGPVDPKDAALTKRSVDLAMKIQKESTDESAKADLTKELKDVLAEQFTARQASRKKELAELQDRVAKLEKSIATRDEHRDEIIDKRLSQLLNQPDPMGWEVGPVGSNVTRYEQYFTPAATAPSPLSVYSALVPGVIPPTTPAPPGNVKMGSSARTRSSWLTPAENLQRRIRELEETLQALKAGKSGAESSVNFYFEESAAVEAEDAEEAAEAEREAAEAEREAAEDAAEHAAEEAAEGGDGSAGDVSKAAADSERAAQRRAVEKAKAKSGGK
jgi:hypothetical protein